MHNHTPTRKYAAETNDGARAAVPRDASYVWRDQTCSFIKYNDKYKKQVESKRALSHMNLDLSHLTVVLIIILSSTRPIEI